MKELISLFCNCGCGQLIEWKDHYKYVGWPKFIKGHHSRGKNNCNYGGISEEHKRKLSKSHKNKKASEETKKKMRLSQHKRYKRSPEVIEKLRKNMIGKNNPNYGGVSESHRLNISKSARKRMKSRLERKKVSDGVKRYFEENPEMKLEASNRFKKMWQNPEFREKHLKKILKGLLKRPTSLEQKFIKLIKKYNLPYKYTGDGEFILGGKCPDFINVNGLKVCIEIRPKHMCKIWNKMSAKEYKRQQIDHYKKYGWKYLVIWQDQLINKVDNKLLNLLK